MKRIVSLVLVFVLLLSSIPAVGAASGHNTETRHVVCTSLSSQARSYYTGSYTYDNIAALTPGNTSCLSTVNSAMFKSLHTLMSGTQTKSVSYKSLAEYWKDTDSTTSASKPILFYSDVLSNSYNREHVWPKSRASFYQSNGGSDLHHLRPTDSTINSTRGNHTMGNVKASGTTYETKANGGRTVLWYNAKYSKNGCDGLVEVNDNIKGDVARILLYVYVRWEERNLFENDPNPKQASGDTGGNDGKKVIESLDTLLRWCHDDPVDTWEMKRNDLVQDVQGNRNAFIDYPEFAWLLFGQTLPNDMTTPSGKAKSNGSTPTYRFTAASSNTNFGTVTVSGNTITATPKSGYVVSGYSVSPTGAATVAQSGNVFTVSNLTANCTVTINFAAETPAPSTPTCPHANTETTTVASTCTTNGSRRVVCKDCNAVVASTRLPKAEHSYSVTTVAPTCTQSGSEKKICSVCGDVVQNVLAAKGHAYKDGKCTACGAADPSYSALDSAVVFKDVGQNDWYKSAVDYAINHELFNGMSHNTFEPETPMNRGMLVTVLWRSYLWRTAEKPVVGTNNFSDVPNEQYYAQPVAWAAHNGIVTGTSSTTFSPEDNVTREQLATILYRYTKKLGDDVSTTGDLTKFSDHAKANDWALDALKWAVGAGIISGDKQGNTVYLDPQGNATRAQVATIFMRYLENVVK